MHACATLKVYIQGRDILIGGYGEDRLVGGPDEDILIGDATAYDDAHQALCGIFDEWTRLDADYYARVDHLSNGGGLNGDRVLNESSVYADGASDRLTGGAGQDWFFKSPDGDKITDQHDEGLTHEVPAAIPVAAKMQVDWSSTWQLWDFMAQNKLAQACRDLDDWSSLHLPSSLDAIESEEDGTRYFQSIAEWSDWDGSSGSTSQE